MDPELVSITITVPCQGLIFSTTKNVSHDFCRYCKDQIKYLGHIFRSTVSKTK